MKSFLDTIKEEQQGEKHHVITFGRMSPPTAGHLKLIDKVKEVAKKNNATHTIVVSHTQDSKKNPLTAQQKIKHLKRYVAGPITEAKKSDSTNFVAASKEKPTILHHAAEAHKSGVTHLHVVVGSDRVKEMHHLLHKYNGVEAGHGKYHFKKITVHSAGHRDPDAEGTEGMSATKMREHAKSKNFGEFRKGVPSHVSDTHAKELMHDTRKGMGLHESLDRGMFKAVFVTGGPGSGKDIIIREAISESRIVELNFIQAQEYLADKQKLSEKSNDYRQEAIRNRGPLIINGPADDTTRISYIKEELEELGYDTLMVFVNTTNETSRERNSLLARMMVESIRQEKWLKSQKNTKYFKETFDKFVSFDNTGDIDSKEQDIHEIYENVNNFLDTKTLNETAEDWLIRNSNLNINSLYKEQKNVKSPNRFLKNKTSRRPLQDNNSPFIQFQRKLGKIDDVRDGDIASNSGYTFRTYEESQPKVEVQPQAKEPNFQKDKEQINKKKRWVNSASGAIRSQGVGPEFDTRQQGTVYPMSGMGDVTYRENKEFKKFKQFVEAIDDPGANDMGLAGSMSGASNKEPLVTPADKYALSGVTIKKKKNVKI
jgi:nicotinic acid mononucleotide adenylyltransferase/predicted kinase